MYYLKFYELTRYHSPFLAYVSSTEQFDTQFEQYIKQDYAKNK